MQNEIKAIGVFCDYTADGLWINGFATDLENLLKELNITIPDFKELNEKINKWQLMFEKFNFYLPESNIEAIRESKEYQEFQKLGEEIARRIREIVPDNILVYYWDEAYDRKYAILPEGDFIDITPEEIKESYDSIL